MDDTSNLDRQEKMKIAIALFGLAAVSSVVVSVSTRRKVLINPRTCESKVMGSEEIVLKEPPCQVTLAYMNADGNLECVGAGIRVQIKVDTGIVDGIFTAGHNVEFRSSLWLVKGDKQIEVGLVEEHNLATDAKMLLIPEKVFSLLGVQVADLQPLPSSGMYCSIVGIAGRGTFGQLSRVLPPGGRDISGHTVYEATTMAGYSGAAYTSGKSVYAMHTQGGRRNGGYEMLYLYQWAKILFGVVQESSEDFLREIFKYKDPEIRVHYTDKKAIILEERVGKYHTVDLETFQRHEQAWLDKDFSDDEYESANPRPVVSLNCHGPGVMSRAGSCIQCSHPAQQQEPALSLIQQPSQPSSGLSRTQRRKLKKLGAGATTCTHQDCQPSTSGTLSVANQRTEN